MLTSLLHLPSDDQSMLGLRGHFMLPSHLQKIARDFKLQINTIGGGYFSVASHDPEFDLEKFCPPSIHSSYDILNLSEQRHPVFKTRELKEFLEFLYQPVKISIEKTSDAAKHYSTRAAIRTQMDEERKNIHALLHFAASGSIAFKQNEKNEEAGITQDHDEIEDQILDSDVWAGAQEILHSGIKPQEGFAFKIDPHIIAGNFDGVNQRLLAGHFWDLISQATEKRCSKKSGLIHLSATELEKFCHLAQQDYQTENLLRLVKFEEKLEARVAQIECRIQNLAQSRAFQNLDRDEKISPLARLKILMQATTALSPLLGSTALHDMRARYQFSQQDDSTLSDLAEDYALFLKILERPQACGNLCAAKIEAITEEFYPLLAFSQKMAAILADGYHQKHIQKYFKDEAVRLNRYYSEISQNFATASQAGVSVHPDFMREDYKNILSILEKSAGLKGITPGEILKTISGTALQFGGDLTNFVKKSPVLSAVVFLGVVGLLYSINPQTNPNEHALFIPLAGGGHEKLILDSEIISTMPKEALERSTWHIDMSILGPVKHYLFDNVVAGNAKHILDGTLWGAQNIYSALGLTYNPDSNFLDSGSWVIDHAANGYFRINTVQDSTHTLFWETMAAKGYHYGFKGAGKTIKFLAPIGDLVRQASSRAFEIVRLDRYKGAADRIMALTHGVEEVGVLNLRNSLPGQKNRKGHMSASAPGFYGAGDLYPAYETFLNLQGVAKERAHFETAPLTLDIGPVGFSSLTQKFNVSVNNYQPILQALDQFDLTMAHMADHIGIHASGYQSFLQAALEETRNALMRYRQDSSVQSLHDLQSVLDRTLSSLLSAQMRHMDSSALYEAFFEAAPDAATRQKFCETANKEFGQLKRAAYVTKNLQKISRARSSPKLLTSEYSSLTRADHVTLRASNLGVQIWGALLAGARGLKASSDVVPGKRYILGAAALACIGSVAADLGGFHSSVTDSISRGVGMGYAASLTTVIFGVYNGIQDAVQNHIGGGLLCMTAGTLAGAIHKNGLKPAAGFIREKIHAGSAPHYEGFTIG